MPSVGDESCGVHELGNLDVSRVAREKPALVQSRAAARKDLGSVTVVAAPDGHEVPAAFDHLLGGRRRFVCGKATAEHNRPGQQQHPCHLM